MPFEYVQQLESVSSGAAHPGGNVYAAPVLFEQDASNVPGIVRATDYMWSALAAQNLNSWFGVGFPISNYRCARAAPACRPALQSAGALLLHGPGHWPDSARPALALCLPRRAPCPLPPAPRSLSLKLAHDIGYWDTWPDAIGEDMHCFIKAFLRTQGAARLLPIHAPINMCHISGATYLQGLWARFLQVTAHGAAGPGSSRAGQGAGRRGRARRRRPQALKQQQAPQQLPDAPRLPARPPMPACLPACCCARPSATCAASPTRRT